MTANNKRFQSLPIFRMKKIASVGKNVRPESKPPNITESCLFEDDDGIAGFYLAEKDVPERLKKIATMANNELLGPNVPKTEMGRPIFSTTGKTEERTVQFSTIIGAVKPEEFKRRYLPGYSHVHQVKSAERYIKLMYIFAEECEKLIREVTPELYQKQKELLKNQKIKIGNLWTSSIANFNGAVNTHTDGGNIKGANNIIYFKRKDSEGGNLHINDYGGVVDCANNSLVFYPAFKHTHSVDDIIPTKRGGYRNSLVLYPLNIKYE